MWYSNNVIIVYTSNDKCASWFLMVTHYLTQTQVTPPIPASDKVMIGLWNPIKVEGKEPSVLVV